MSDRFHIESLTPHPLSDGRRVTLILRVSGLAAYGPGAMSHFFDSGNPPEARDEPRESARATNVELFPEVSPPGQDTSETGPSAMPQRQPSPFPDVALSILDPHGNEIAAAYIVEHKEPELDFTLHVRDMEPGARYIARAEMTKNDEILQVVEVSFGFAGDLSENAGP